MSSCFVVISWFIPHYSHGGSCFHSQLAGGKSEAQRDTMDGRVGAQTTAREQKRGQVGGWGRVPAGCPQGPGSSLVSVVLPRGGHKSTCHSAGGFNFSHPGVPCHPVPYTSSGLQIPVYRHTSLKTQSASPMGSALTLISNPTTPRLLWGQVGGGGGRGRRSPRGRLFKNRNSFQDKAKSGSLLMRGGARPLGADLGG